MNAERLLAHYEKIADAPEAIPRLRRFVLRLAVRGKLVPQDPKDERASELLRRIAKEKERLVKAGRIKEAKSVCLAEPSGSRQELPDFWEWVPFSDAINSHLGGGTPSKANSTYWSGEIPWASVKDVGKTKYLDDTIDHITEAGLADSSSNLVPKGCLIVVTRMGLGKVSINRRSLAINQDLRALSLSSLVDIDYCYIFLKTHGFEGTGMTVKGIKVEELLSIPFPLPPLAEQRRIVAKVDELMALCDRLEATRAEQEATRDRLATASLARLNAPKPETFQAEARFALDALPALTARHDQIKGLRQTILNLAVRGKLVPQDPKEEPASELLARLAVKKSKARSGRDWSQGVGLRHAPGFEPPLGWSWTTIDQTAHRVTVGYVGPMKDQYVPTGVPFLRGQNVRANKFREEGLIYVSPEFHRKIIKSALAPGDVVVVRSGNVGTACVIPPTIKEANCSDLVVIQKPECALPEFLCFYLNSLATAHIEAGSVGVALTHFNTKSVGTMPLALPPLAEQHRIVAKVDELMALCDRLEASLITADDSRRRLLEALLEDALATDRERELEAA